ncbi:hypothetical protein GCM10009838_25740 [Catenulispora subtropica]|uniref:ABC3 transporter permease C-terminal domain-containing protein n=1 Tax=Catenulispora subtropica TaxID=450798 RepID=A0ABN2RBZ2_9ACTN
MRGWALALRVARREALRNKGRSLLVVAMLALPVAGASAADTLWRSSQVTGTEQAVRDMGRYDAMVTAMSGTPVYQNASGSRSLPADLHANSATGFTGPGDAAALAALLPPQAKIVGPVARDMMNAVIADSTGRRFAIVREIDLADPLTEGVAVRRAGSPPAADDQVAISKSLSGKLGKGVGATIDVRIADGGPDTAPIAKTLHVSGVYDSNDDLYADLMFARRGTFAGGAQFYGTAYFVSVPGGLDWSQVLKLNQRGFTVESKKVVADPPPHSQMPYYTTSMAAGYGEGGVDTSTVAVAAIALAMVLLEVVLLAGPAFAVSARRRRRDFGLFGAAGADSRRLRRVVLADGVVLGLVGGVAGTVAGVVGGAVTLPWFAHLSRQNPGGFRIMPDELLAAAAVGVLTGLAAALAPAIVTGRQEVLVALTGRRGQVRTPWKMSVAGLVALGAGTVLIVAGALSGAHTWPVAAGIAVAELGVVACTPLLVSWFARLGRVLPLTGRLAVRDGARNRGRTAPAVAAIMAAVAGASAVAMIVTSLDAQSRHDYASDLRPGQAALTLDAGIAQTPDKLAAQIAAVLPSSGYAVINAVSIPAVSAPDTTAKTTPKVLISLTPFIKRAAANECPPTDGLPLDAQRQAFDRQRTDPRCVSRTEYSTVTDHYPTSSILVGGPEVARVVLGRSDPAAEAALKSGGAVVFNPMDLYTSGPHPTLQIAVSRDCEPQDGGPNSVETSPDQPAAGGGPPCTGSLPAPVILPAVRLDGRNPHVMAIVAPGALDKLGVKPSPQAVVFENTRVPTEAEEKKADDLAAAAGITQSFYVERGYQGQTWVGLLALAGVAGVVMLGAAAVATGLAITDAQSDLETLAAVGARPRVRRALAGSQAAATAGLGALLGGLFGLLPAVGLLEVKHSSETKFAPFGAQAGPAQLAVPWLFLLLVIVALPALAAFGAAGMTRSRITMRQRRD